MSSSKRKRFMLKVDPFKTIVLIRFVVGAVFLSEGIQKFLFPEVRGSGRFYDIGLAAAEFLGSFVGFFEILCGILLIIGFITRLATIPLIIIMIVAFITTKAEVYAEKGFWELLHGSRTDWSMLLCSIFLLINGAGNYSIDNYKRKA